MSPKSTMCCWFTDIDRMVEAAKRLRRASAYVCLNPAGRKLLDISHRVVKRVNSRTKDEHVTALRWWYIDVDSVKPSEVSATDEQLAATVAVRDQILADNPDIRRCSMLGKSGNESWIAVRLPD